MIVSAPNWIGSSNLFIDNSKFSVGLYLIINSSNVHVTITNSVFSFNIVNGITIYFEVFTGNFIEMSNITISNNNVGLYIMVISNCSPSGPHYLMKISNMTNTRNSVLSFVITDNMNPDENCAALYITVRDSVITENMLVRHPTLPSASVLFSSASSRFKTIEITFDNVSVSNSKCVSVYLLNVQNMTFINCTFESNQDTAIKAVGSNLAFGGNNTFRNNSAVSGAGITLLQNSYLDPMDQANITFIDNYASDKGGAVYFATGSILPTEF